jgi:hypothetical protein
MTIKIPAIVGQPIQTLPLFSFIYGKQISVVDFAFDISQFSTAIDTTDGQLLASFVYDYTQVNNTSTFLNAFLPYTDGSWHYTLDVNQLYLFASADKNTFVVIDPVNYSGSIDSILSTLTIHFTTDILDGYSYLTIGYLDSLDSTNYILSKNILEL